MESGTNQLKPPPQELGKQYIVDFHGCNAETLKDVRQVAEAMKTAARLMNATIVDTLFHQFSPYGVSGVVVISESHLAIHTWPEYGFAAVDVFTCGPLDVHKGIHFLKTAFGATKIEVNMVERGGQSSKSGLIGSDA
jgi:S-adenosylmethionine decarboxylase